LLQQSIGNYLVSVIDNPIRGIVTDRNGIVLVDNKLDYKLVILARDAKEDPDQIYLLTKYINLTKKDTDKYYKQLKNSSNNDWLIIKENLNSKELATLSAHMMDMSNIQILTQAKRSYIYGALYAHSIGYVSKINTHKRSSEDKIYKDNYNNLDLIGINGIENSYEKILRGKPGVHKIQVDTYGDELQLAAAPASSDNTVIRDQIDQAIADIIDNPKIPTLEYANIAAIEADVIASAKAAELIADVGNIIIPIPPTNDDDGTFRFSRGSRQG
jgi:cell division protein FtsI/penicillin-binding protein 2